jgi:choline dehydrogenase
MHHPANDAFTVAAHESGHAKLADYNGAEQIGVGHVQVNQRRGVRCQASRAYLRARPARHHLTIRTKAFVRRIVFDGERAIGVEYEHRGRRRFARAAREVVVSAGSIASPKILMVSGIGPRDHLETLGIDVVHDLPGVGANLQEHIAVMQRWHATVPTLNTMGPVRALGSVGEYLRHRTGNLAATVCHVQVMHRLDDATDVPDAQLTFASFATVRDVDPDGILKVQPAREDGFLVTALSLHPRVRGRIRLRSADPDARPVIDHALVGDPDDLRGVLAGMTEARRIMSAPAMAHMIGPQFEPEAGCRTENDWEEFVRANVTYGAHPVGTCCMGTDGDAVVDPDLRVKGTSGLRVVDASVMPTVTSGNTNAPTMMIGEKGAELLLTT